MIVSKHPEAVWSGRHFHSTAVLHKGTLSSVLNICVVDDDKFTLYSRSDTCTLSTLDLTKTPHMVHLDAYPQNEFKEIGGADDDDKWEITNRFDPGWPSTKPISDPNNNRICGAISCGSSTFLSKH